MTKQLLELKINGEHLKFIRTTKKGLIKIRFNESIEYINPEIMEKIYKEKYKGKKVELEYC
jgi:hypothetical protein|tara:strand:+ start:238 stop:420 length:183 start_codon:yes stop_codon:yes gene_type:complete